MSTDRLTKRAKEVLLSVPSDKKVSAGAFMDAIVNSGGMGSMILKSFPNIDVDKEAIIDINKLLKEAFYQAIKMENPYVGTEHLLLAMLKLLFSRDFESARTELFKMNVFPNAYKSLERGRKTPLLDSFGENINNRMLRDFNRPLIFRDEYNALVSVLLQKNNANALLVGENGVGKRSLIELLAKNIDTLNVPPLLVGYQVIEFDLLSFMTSILNKGGVDFGLVALAEELKSLGRVFLSIKNFQNLFFSTGGGFTVPMFYSMFRNTLESIGVKTIACINPTLFEKINADNEQVLDNFSVIEVDEPDESQILTLLELNAGYLGEFHNVSITEPVIKYVYKSAKNQLKDMKFPQKGLDLLDQACARLIMKKSKMPEKYKTLVDKTLLLAHSLDASIEKGDFNSALKSRKQIRKNESALVKVEKAVFTRNKLRLTISQVDEALFDMGINHKDKVEDKNMNMLTNLSLKMKRRIIGQDEAIDIVVKSLVRAKLGLRSKKRPLGNFLFLGPTGVGKTELAKVLAEAVFPSKLGVGSLIRLDMSDFSEKHTVARLVGAPPGYVGYGEGGELTQKIESKPDSVVLFDEIEKAHPDVLNILLQIMEEGELSDAKGNNFDFSKAVIILTSNIGTELVQNGGIGFDEKVLSDENVEERLKLNLKKILKPELINRFDEVIVFRKLNNSDQMKVLNLLIGDITKTLREQDVYLKTNLKCRSLLLKKGYSSEYGARSLRRVVEKELLDRIAEVLLARKDRPLFIAITTKEGAFELSTKPLKDVKKRK